MSTPAELIPMTWLDPLLSGPSKVIGEGPYTGADIENLLRALKKRLQESPPQATPKDAEPVAWMYVSKLTPRHARKEVYLHRVDETVRDENWHTLWQEFPLYTHAPDTSADRRDAERWRALRDGDVNIEGLFDYSHKPELRIQCLAALEDMYAGEFLDIAIDAAIARESAGQNNQGGEVT